ncbi:hypothetical protein D3C80_2224720 [compost metagenome]
MSITPVYNENNKLMYFIGIQKDVSQQVEAEQRVVELEQQVADLQARLRALEGDER